MSYLRFDKTLMINLQESLPREILRTNRSGAYHCTTIVDCNTRKYHGLLVIPVPNLDDENHVLLSSLDETVIQHGAEFNLGLHKYQGNHFSPNGHKYIREFDCENIPTTTYRVGGVILRKEKIFVHHENRILIRYTLVDAHSATTLRFRPFLAFRSVREYTHENAQASRDYQLVENGIKTCMYPGYPELFMQLNKKNEIKAEIQAAVGLTFEQFCRTTMLAQGDFTKFLQSKESEKSDILEKLTGTSIYSEIGAEIYAATKERRTEYENQNRKLEGIHNLAEEEVTAIKEAIATQNAGVKEANEQKTTALAKRDWLKKYSELLLTREQQKKMWEGKQAQLQSDEFKQKELLIKEWNATADARNWLSTLKQQQQQQQQQQGGMSKENAQQILDAMQEDERDTQEKVQKALMQQQQRKKTDKEW